MNKKTVKIRVSIDAISQDISVFDAITWGKVICVKKGAIKLTPGKDYIQHHGKINETDRITLKEKFIKKYKIKESVLLSFVIDMDKTEIIDFTSKDKGEFSISFKDSLSRLFIVPVKTTNLFIDKVYYNGMLLTQGTDEDYVLNRFPSDIHLNVMNLSPKDKISLEVRLDGSLDFSKIGKVNEE